MVRKREDSFGLKETISRIAGICWNAFQCSRLVKSCDYSKERRESHDLGATKKQRNFLLGALACVDSKWFPISQQY